MAMNNQQAVVHVGQMVPRYRGAVVNTNSTQINVDDESVGLMLTITPNISPEDNIVMSVVAKKSSINHNANEAVEIGSSEGGKAIQSQPIDLISAATMVSAGNNETVVLGGLLSRENQERNRKVPLLGDIPVVGRLFRYDYTKCQKKELLIILTPRIIREKEDTSQVKQMEVARMSWCLRNVSNLYGDIGAYNVISDKPYTGNAEVIRPDDSPLFAPALPAPVLPNK
jgi:type II secretory pathway component GspD/PulD (secretin)